MNVLFPKFLTKKESGMHVLSSIINEGAGGKRMGTGLLPAILLNVSGMISKRKKSRSVNISPKNSKPEFTIVGCRIADTSTAFGEHEFKVIEKRIENAYSNDMEWMFRNINSYDKTIIADLLLSHVGSVVENQFVYPEAPEDTEFYTSMQDRISKWVFPQVAHQGRCRLAFSEKYRA